MTKPPSVSSFTRKHRLEALADGRFASTLAGPPVNARVIGSAAAA